MMRHTFLLLTATLSLSACSLLQGKNFGTTPASYSSYSEDPGDLDVRLGERRNDVARSLGLAPYNDLSNSDRRLVDDRMNLIIAERRLEGERDKETYYRAKPEFGSDRERIKFLHLDSPEARQAYLQKHGLLSSPDRFAADDAHMIVDQDIAVGMNKRAVRASWGDPDNVEVAGNSMYGNERWNYTQSVASTEGFKTLKRTIYFEGGQVVGWESGNLH